MLRVESMGVTYPGNVLALKPTNVHFHKGEFTVLLGLSGAGKSTLLRSLNHLVKPTTGKVVSGEFGELTNRRILRQHRSRTAMVFQHHQLIERYTALQNVLTGRLAYHGTWRSLLPLPRQDLELALQYCAIFVRKMESPRLFPCTNWNTPRVLQTGSSAFRTLISFLTMLLKT